MVDGGEGIKVWVGFKYFGDRLGLSVADVALPMVGGEDSPHDVGFVGEIVAWFFDSGGSIDFKGECQLHPSNTGVAGCYAFPPFPSVV